MPDQIVDQVRLAIKCAEVKNVDGVLGKSDPKCDIWRKSDGREWFKIGSTEPIRNNLNPEFKTKIMTEYEYEGNVQLKFEIIDVDSKDANKNKKIGAFVVKLQDLISAPNLIRSGDLENETLPGQKLGTITVRAEVVQGRPDDTLKFNMKGIAIANKDGPLKGASDPYLIFHKVLPDGTKEKVEGGKTEYVSSSKAPEWKPAFMNLMDLCNGKMDQKIWIECWDYDAMSSHDPIGNVETTLGAILSQEPIQLKDYKEGRDLNPGQLQLASGGIVRAPIFADYQEEPAIQLKVTFGIDFTVTENDKVHKKHDHAFNLYEQAIHNTGEWLDLGNSITYNVYGFGGKFDGSEEVSHCFKIGEGLKTSTECQTKYWSYIKNEKVVMEKQRNLTQMIEEATKLAQDQSTPHYHVLLIITHKGIDDGAKAARAVVEASKAPLSIVVLGVGEGDFDNMKDLKPVVAQASGSFAITYDEPPIQETETREKAVRNPLQFCESLRKETKAVLEKQYLQYMCWSKTAPRAWSTQPYILPESEWQPTVLIPTPDAFAKHRDIDLGDLSAAVEGAAGA